MSFFYGNSGIEKEEKLKQATPELIRKRCSYEKWRNVLTRLKKCKNDMERLKLIYEVVDEHKGFHYAWLSYANEQSVDLIIQEEKPKTVEIFFIQEW